MFRFLLLQESVVKGRGGVSQSQICLLNKYRLNNYNFGLVFKLRFCQGGLTSVYKTEIVQNLVHHEPQCLYTYISAGVL